MISERLDVRYQTLNNWRKRGIDIPLSKMGFTWRMEEKTYELWIASLLPKKFIREHLHDGKFQSGKMLNSYQACSYLQISLRRLSTWINSDIGLPIVKLSGTSRFPQNYLQKWVSAQLPSHYSDILNVAIEAAIDHDGDASSRRLPRVS